MSTKLATIKVNGLSDKGGHRARYLTQQITKHEYDIIAVQETNNALFLTPLGYAKIINLGEGGTTPRALCSSIEPT